MCSSNNSGYAKALKDLERVIESVPQANPPPASRRRIWEVPGGFQCSILGLCLSQERGAKILRKTTARLPKMDDYQLHCALVDAATQPGPAARLISKALDRAHAQALKRYAKLDTEEELRAAWSSDVEHGDTPGAYWSIMSHPGATNLLLSEAFGVVHMLNHRAGFTSSTKLQRFEELSARTEALEGKQAEERAQAERVQAGMRRELEATRLLLSAAQEETARLRSQMAAIDDATVAELQKRSEGQARALDSTRRRLRHALEAVARKDEELTQAAGLVAQLSADLEALKEVTEVPEPSKTVPSLPIRSRCQDCDLSGQIILYVGGERAMVSHLRRLAGVANSELLHHDGGIEDGMGALPRLCARADAVFCPLDRVSHSAVAEVKRACSANGKTFVPLRRSSLDAFERGLVQVANGGRA